MTYYALLLGCLLVSVITATEGVRAGRDLPCRTTASSTPPLFFGPKPYSMHAPSPASFWYGTDALWTILRDDGRWGALYLSDQRVYRNKVFVWRKGYNSRREPKPPLTLVATRVDEHAPKILVRDATHASAEGIGTAMLTAANLPAAGCWEFTAHYGPQTLTFTVSVP